MHGRFQYGKLSKYPHLGPKDAALWERFIDKYPNRYEKVDYDCWVGEGAIPPEEAAGNVYKENFADLTKKRVDVCGTKPNGDVDCIEIRPHAGSSAIGTVKVNRRLHADDLGDRINHKIIITDMAQADMARLCDEYGIELIELDKI